MSRASRLAIVPLAVAAALSIGCSGAFTRAAATYGDAAKKSAAAVAGAPLLLSKLCRKDAEMNYLYGRFNKSAKVKPWTRFYKEDQASHDDKLTWEAYCAAVDERSKLFSDGVAAVHAYGAALAALARQGEYDGSAVRALADHASSIAGALGSDKASSAIKPVGGALKNFSSFIVAGYTERQIKKYVNDGAPHVRAILGPLASYIAAVDEAWLSARNNPRAQAIDAAEGAIVAQSPDASKYLAFYQFASALEADTREARAVLAGYHDVLQQMEAAHEKLVSAARDGGTEDDVKKALGAVLDLVKQLQALKSAIANKE